MKKILIFFEESCQKSALDLLEVAHQMYPTDVYETYALCVNHHGEEAEGKFDYRINIWQEQIKWHDVLNLTNVIEELHQKEQFDTILMLASWVGRMLAPRTATRLKTGLVADVTAINSEGSNIQMVRPAFDGKILAGIVNNNSGPIMMSVRAGVFSYQQEFEKATKDMLFCSKSFQKDGVELVALREKEKTSDIRESRVLVSGGGGMGEHFPILYPLAEELKGLVSASRRIVDNNQASRSIQVGQTGKVVSPDLYFALGIHGSMQHFEGLKNVKHMIAVNTNPYAPLCSQADIVVVGDGEKFVKGLMAKIEEKKREK